MLSAAETGPVHMSGSPLLTSAGPFCRRSSTAAVAVALAHNSAADHVAATFILLGLSRWYYGGRPVGSILVAGWEMGPMFYSIAIQRR
jgi:hypothetical protein